MADVYLPGKTNPIHLAERKDIVNPNLISGTSDNLQSYTIPKGQYYPGYLFDKIKVNDNKVKTFSAYIVNNTDTALLAHFDGENGSHESNAIAPHSSGRVVVTNASHNGLYIHTSDFVKATEDISFQIKDAKVEYGSIATAWCPAYSDYAMQSDLDSIKSDIAAIKSKLGGVIKPAICLATVRKAVA